MPSTFLSLHFHIVFATKGRVPLIADYWKFQLHEYLGGIVNGLGGTPHGVGGMADHVHLLVDLKATHCLADFVRELKKSSSSWAQAKRGADPFAWQVGYSAFTVSPSARESVRNYIKNQEEHHRSKSFREELIELLEKAGVPYDARYLD